MNLVDIDGTFCQLLTLVETSSCESCSYKITLNSNKAAHSNQSYSTMYCITNINHGFGSFLGWLLKSSWLWMKDSMMERCAICT